MSATQGTFSVAELVGIVVGTTAAVLIIISVILLSVIRRRRRRRETAGRDWDYQPPQTWEETLPRQSQAAPIPQQPVMRQTTPPMDLSPIFSPTSTHNLEEALLSAERINSHTRPEPLPYQYSHSQTTSPIQYHNHHQFPNHPAPPAPVIIPLYHRHQQQYIRKEADSNSPQSPTHSSPISPYYPSPSSASPARPPHRTQPAAAGSPRRGAAAGGTGRCSARTRRRAVSEGCRR
ncbi:hypothetical protein MCOR02_000613 [Pyricularia oryzae]|nr:hypothetical protein MCOR02_000613 [Pyricularia oryzae]